MKFHTKNGHSALSEDFAPYSPPGSIHFAQPAEVDSWCQSIGFPTPPDTASECSFSDCSDMNASMWSQATLPEESWNTASASDHSTSMQTSGDGWHPLGEPVTSQDLHALDTSTWLNVSQGSVELGLSPALSHESQSAHSLHSVPEPEGTLLSPGLDLSFVAESSWDPSGSVVYTSAQMPQDLSASAALYPQEMSIGYPTGHLQPGYTGASAMFEPQQPLYYFQGNQVSTSEKSVPDAFIAPPRPLLPRTDAHPSSGMQTSGRFLSIQGQTASTGPSDAVRVSSITSLPETVIVQGSPYFPHQGPSAHRALIIPPGHTLMSPAAEDLTAGQPTRPGFVTDHANEEFSTFIRYDQDDKSSAAAASYMSTLPHSKVITPSDAKAIISPRGPDGSARNQAIIATSTPGELDEGRYRSHPLYSEGPRADGLYHCPFKTDPSCQHKPTKLKCNYDKFVDSHLKPFRCKVDACSKQEFSSTACLLRHEREAHGMHGHGDRPHLCYYPGCERGIPGNGFPRRYNLFDHMKRVHDHKEEPAISSPDSQGPRKAAGRKRKAPSSVSSEPATQRPKLQEPTPEAEVPKHVLAAQPQAPCYYDGHQEHIRQRNLYPQWSKQNELPEFPLNAVRSSVDVHSLQHLSHNVESLRRLSRKARQG